MAFGIYKPGQGYWTRVLTAVGLGVLVLAGVGWLTGQLKAIPIQKTAWRAPVSDSHGTPVPGMRVALFADDRGETRLAEATIGAVENGGRELLIERVDVVGKADPGSTRRIEALSAGIGAAQAPEYSATVTRRPQGIAAFNLLYLQAGVAAGIVILATALIYWFIAIKPAPNEFLIAVDAEMRKVNWSTKREVYGSTSVVLVVFVTITLLLFLVDSGLASFFRAIGVLGI